MLIVLGYTFTTVNYILYCLSRFLRHKKSMLLMDLAAKIFTILGLYCLGSLSGAFAFGIILFSLILANLKERLHKRWLPIYLLLQMAHITSLVLTYQGLPSILVFTTASISLFANWWLPPQKLRFTGGCNTLIYLAYQISIKN